MCRILARVALAPAAFAGPLFSDSNALRHQSQRDRRGVANKDGWGIAWWNPSGHLQLTKEPVAAHTSDDYAALAQSITSPMLLAHVRHATVGAHTPENTHPFVLRGWAFAHNGYIAHFHDRVEPEVEKLIDPCVLAETTGHTDSEHWFALFLTNLGHEKAASPHGSHTDHALAALARTMQQIEQLAVDCTGTAKTESNFVLTDGTVLLAVRWRHTLWMRQTDDAIVIASEPSSDEPGWVEIPEFRAMAITGDGQFAIRSVDVPHRALPAALDPPEALALPPVLTDPVRPHHAGGPRC